MPDKLNSTGEVALYQGWYNSHFHRTIKSVLQSNSQNLKSSENPMKLCACKVCAAKKWIGEMSVSASSFHWICICFKRYDSQKHYQSSDSPQHEWSYHAKVSVK